MVKKTIVVASDSFKGTISSLRICELFKNEINQEKINAIYIPIADGGEGSLESISHILDGRYVDVFVHDLYFQEISTRYYVDNNYNAYIETASCAGLTLAKKNNNPGLVTTYGLGEQIKSAIELGCKSIYLFLGGSATNDGGVGLAAALGTKFYDKDNNEFVPTGLALKHIAHINNKDTEKLIQGVHIFALADVKSPFFGLEGAAYKFAPQKGADPATVKELDDGLKHLADIVKQDLDIDINVPGSGAAGGLGGGLYAFLSAEISSGIKTLLDLIDFKSIISRSDLVISGEGKLDLQTYDGKVIDGISKKCIEMNKPLDLIVGISEVDEKDIKTTYPCIRHIYETNEKHLPFNRVKKHAEDDYIKQIRKLLDNL